MRCGEEGSSHSVIKWEPKNLLLCPQKPAVGLSSVAALAIPYTLFHVWVSQVTESLEVLQLKVLMPVLLVLGTKYWNIEPLAHLRFKFKGILKYSIEVSWCMLLMYYIVNEAYVFPDILGMVGTVELPNFPSIFSLN
jgi:hypothetical protein